MIPLTPTGFETRVLRIPLVTPFETSFARQTEREVILVRAVTQDAEGWGECVTMPVPLYSSEHTEGAWDVLHRFLYPALLGNGPVNPLLVAGRLEHVVGHRMAKAAVELSLVDAGLRATGESFASFLGAERTFVPSGVSVGIMSTLDELLSTVQDYLDQGYARIKIKIKPGWDVEPTRLLRETFGDGLLLQVDANAAYTLADARLLRRLDDLDLLLIEQPLAEDDLRQHAELAKQLRTPICLDESIVSAKVAADAIVLGATQAINIKAGRVGGYLEAARIHQVALAHGIPAWCGGMLETGIGRAANAALAALPGFTLPGDISASDRFYAQDITAPFVLDEGRIAVPTGPGLGVEVDPVRLEEVTVRSEWTRAPSRPGRTS
ncbi:o-succinylbenzoate synthase [Actinotalea sp. K2]|uniref:o-succinylbenzoate synthase n=1 Tax=Actinotalea sp. K2 TaxID=2939438 RepID=UPI0020177D10|nr:o-succinylbenzoate synthase [Actinotalea sp. K2]MCL3862464.1 o-succinylbenzoate synthase [Actinotalea sp. K2]